MDARVFSDTFDSDYRTIIAAVGVIINQLCGRLSYLAVTGSASDNNFWDTETDTATGHPRGDWLIYGRVSNRSSVTVGSSDTNIYTKHRP